MSDRYKKKKKGPKILTETRRLRDSITHAVDSANSVVIGTNVPYAPHHQYGTGGRKASGSRSQVLAWSAVFFLGSAAASSAFFLLSS